MPLYEITITAFKYFYVKASSESAAYKKAEDESHPGRHGDFEWEHDETRANKLDVKSAKYVRLRHPEKILREE